MNPIRYGIVGFGGIAEQRIAKEGFGLDTARFSPNLEARLVLACDEDGRRQDAARALGVDWCSDFDKMLSDASVDAVVVASNNRSHAPLARRALLAGKHVLVEKPAGVAPDEVRELIEIAGSKRLSLAVDHMMTKNAYNVLARDLLRESSIGDFVHLVLHMEFAYGMNLHEAASWRCADPRELGGPLGDVGSHCLYMAEFLAGDLIEKIRCVYTPKHLGTAVEDGAIIHFITRRGIPGTVRVAFDQQRGTLEETIGNLGYEVYGSAGALIARGTLFQLSGHTDEPVGLSLCSRIDGTFTSYSLQAVENIYRRQINEHAASIRNGKPLQGTDGLHNLELILLAHESAKRNGIQLSVSRNDPEPEMTAT